MKSDNLELAITQMFSLFPLFQRKLMKPENLMGNTDLTHSHFQIIFILNEFGRLPVSEVGKKVMISRPNMTPLIDKLIREKLVERIPGEEDRRIINIELTDQGRSFMADFQKKMANYFKERFSSLAEEDLIQLAASLENIKNVILKLT